MNKDTIQRYVNNFRRGLSKYLKPNIGLQLDIYNCNSEGGMIVIYFKPGGESFDNHIEKYTKISDALKDMNQRFFSGDLSGLHFSGTNTMMDNEKILLIKDSSIKEWSDSKLNEDLKSITQPPKSKGGQNEAR